MKKDCECSCCKNNVNEYFCVRCGFNFNRCEVHKWFHESTGDLPSFGIALCPKCHPSDFEENHSQIPEARINTPKLLKPKGKGSIKDKSLKEAVKKVSNSRKQLI